MIAIFRREFTVAGALTLASSMLYPKTLAGAAVFSGWVPLDKAAFAAKITPAAKQVSTTISVSFSNIGFQAKNGRIPRNKPLEVT